MIRRALHAGKHAAREFRSTTEGNQSECSRPERPRFHDSETLARVRKIVNNDEDPRGEERGRGSGRGRECSKGHLKGSASAKESEKGEVGEARRNGVSA